MADPMLDKANSKGRPAKFVTPQLGHICCTVGEEGINYDTTVEIYGGKQVYEEEPSEKYGEMD